MLAVCEFCGHQSIRLNSTRSLFNQHEGKIRMSLKWTAPHHFAFVRKDCNFASIFAMISLMTLSLIDQNQNSRDPLRLLPMPLLEVTAPWPPMAGFPCCCCWRASASGSISTAVMASRRLLFLMTYKVGSGSLGVIMPKDDSLTMLRSAHELRAHVHDVNRISPFHQFLKVWGGGAALRFCNTLVKVIKRGRKKESECMVHNMVCGSRGSICLFITLWRLEAKQRPPSHR